MRRRFKTENKHLTMILGVSIVMAGVLVILLGALCYFYFGYDEIEVNGLKIVLNDSETDDSDFWKIEVLDQIEHTVDCEYDTDKVLQSVRYVIDYTEENDNVLMSYLCDLYGNGTAMDESCESFIWIYRTLDGMTYEIQKYIEEGDIIIAIDMHEGTYESWNYAIPDSYNTGYTSDYDELVDFAEKYPECVLNDGRYVITQSSVLLYGNVFSGFKSDMNISVLNLTSSIVIEDFYMDSSNIINDYNNNAEDTMIILRNGELEGGMIRACNMIIEGIYMHDATGDFVNILYNVSIYDSYFENGGVDSSAHADGVQIAGYDDEDAHDIYMENVRIDMPVIPGHVANACVMIQPDYGAVDGMELNRCILNGGGFTIYSYPKKNTISNVVFNDTLLGYGERFGVYYGESQQNMEEYNTERISEPLVGTVAIQDDTLYYGISNYMPTTYTVEGVVTYISGGEEEYQTTFSNEIEAYLLYEEYEGSWLSPNLPMNVLYDVEVPDVVYDAAIVQFYYNGEFIYGCYISD